MGLREREREAVGCPALSPRVVFSDFTQPTDAVKSMVYFCRPQRLEALGSFLTSVR